MNGAVQEEKDSKVVPEKRCTISYIYSHFMYFSNLMPNKCLFVYFPVTCHERAYATDKTINLHDNIPR